MNMFALMKPIICVFWPGTGATRKRGINFFSFFSVYFVMTTKQKTADQVAGRCGAASRSRLANMTDLAEMGPFAHLPRPEWNR